VTTTIHGSTNQQTVGRFHGCVDLKTMMKCSKINAHGPKLPENLNKQLKKDCITVKRVQNLLLDGTRCGTVILPSFSSSSKVQETMSISVENHLSIPFSSSKVKF
jgi:hypothetical protein